MVNDFFKDEYLTGKPVEKMSPSGRFRLVISVYDTTAVTGECTYGSRGQLYRVSDGVLIADVKRYYSAFHHSFQTKDGQEYLITGRSCTGQTIINCDEGWEVSTPDKFDDGFCWATHWLSQDGKTLVVDGCYWACSYELKFFDFTNPRELPLPELEQGLLCGDTYEISETGGGWRGDVFHAKANVARRKLDNKIHAGKWSRDMSHEQVAEVEALAQQESRTEDSYYEYVAIEKVIFRRDGTKIVRELSSAAEE